jgi:polyisoprenoid-binding protein YceI
MSSTGDALRPGRYRIDPEHSTVEVHTTHLFGLGGVEATFALRRAEVLLAERWEDSSVEAVVDSGSFNSRHRGRDKRVRSKALLNAEAYPEIGFASVSISTADGSGVARGILTACGHDAPFELSIVSIAELDGTMSVVATGTVDRYAHGITKAKGFAGRYLDVTVTAIGHRIP